MQELRLTFNQNGSKTTDDIYISWCYATPCLYMYPLEIQPDYVISR